METIRFAITRRQLLRLIGATAGATLCPAWGEELKGIDPQPYFAGVGRTLEALAGLGSPIAPEDAQQIATSARTGRASAVEAAEKILDRYTLARLSIDADGYPGVALGGASRVLAEQGWRMFLVRIENPAARTDEIRFSREGMTPGQMMPEWSTAQRAYLMDTTNKAPLIEKMWLLSEMYVGAPSHDEMAYSLSAVPVEYQIIQLFSRDRGQRTAELTLSTYPKSGDPGWNTKKKFDFDCLPTRDIVLAVWDVDRRGCVASFTIKDLRGHVYPPQAMRLAPDMFFQEQIYRGDGETVRLPDGEYTVESWRGPEYLKDIQTVVIGDTNDRIEVKLKRWIDPAQWGWYSSDTHIHAAGCAHYANPTEGVSPETMIRQVRGEALSIGDILTWGPGWYYQKQFFSGHVISPAATLEHPELQAANNANLKPHSTPEDSESTLRYDMEVSGFPSSHAGHLVLLRLKEQDYPGANLIEDWPSWNLPILKWARSQGSVGGYAHCGSGMIVDSKDLPNYEIPPMDGMGTQEAIVDVTHGFADFLSGCDTRPLAELNAWYHMLNCGFRLPMIGETDFPCVSGDRPGVGRSYVRLDHRPVGNAGYEAWIRSLQQGRLYCGDGRSHFLDFKVNGRRNGEGDLALKTPGTLNIEALVAARLEPKPPADILTIKHVPRGNGWHLENARIGDTNEVAVELVVNGFAVDKTTLVADGTPRPITFKAPIDRSSWVALRILPSAHTSPVFVLVGKKPIRASRRSAQWCRTCVDKVWEVKSPFIRESERPAAAEAFDHARKVYEIILAECEVD